MPRESSKTLVFAGQFEIFEQATQLHKKIIADALKLSEEEKADLAMLVGDIGVGQKIEAYSQHGVAGVEAIYLNRIKGATTGCAMTQLPSVDKLAKVIDEAALKKASQIIRKADNNLAEALQKSETTSEQQQKLFYLARERVCPELVKARLAEYGLAKKPVKLFFERQLKNQVSFKMREQRAKRKNSWLPLAKKLEKINPMAALIFSEVQKGEVPSCRGIMLELYTEIALQGYAKLIQLYPTTHELALKNAQGLYEMLNEAFPSDPRWRLKFEYKFYEENFF